uniref:CCHC-type domain-containing protein n=1 Tax=Amphimedon queenslandica TaxID=400682 RepID=A0A1X7UUR0_AMPQE
MCEDAKAACDALKGHLQQDSSALIHEQESKPSGAWEQDAGRALTGRNHQRRGGNPRKKVCYLCGEPGHFRTDCPKNRQTHNAHPQISSAKPKHKVKHTYANAEEECNEDSFDEEFCNNESQPDNEDLIVDSGASSHMTRSRKVLINYEEFSKPQTVSLGDGCTVEEIGKGDIYLMMIFRSSDPKKVKGCNALYVPKLACNLLSVRAVISKGNTVKFGDTRCWIRNKIGGLVGIAQIRDKLFHFHCKTVTQEHVAALSVESKVGSKINLWHQ